MKTSFLSPLPQNVERLVFARLTQTSCLPSLFFHSLFLRISIVKKYGLEEGCSLPRDALDKIGKNYFPSGTSSFCASPSMRGVKRSSTPIRAKKGNSSAAFFPFYTFFSSYRGRARTYLYTKLKKGHGNRESSFFFPPRIFPFPLGHKEIDSTIPPLNPDGTKWLP